MGSKHYVYDEDALPQELVTQLRAATGRARSITFRRPGASLNPTEAILPFALVERIRAALTFEHRQYSCTLYVRPRGDVPRQVAALAHHYSPTAIANALGVSRETVRRYKPDGGKKRYSPVPESTADLLAGLAAIRNRQRINQADVAEALGVSTATLCKYEHGEAAPPELVTSYTAAMATMLRCSVNVLHKQASEAGAALRAISRLPAQ